ncbi:MAG: tRNA pseudouridine(55) synthase TruB [Treponema sp.]|jgi:tRNA pseudouridine55 synthase|nr:tRNA pseudouridine(55) synthase TruB [Treponema sp.]
MNPPPDGLILFHKPPGLTSFDALRGIKRILGTGKVGHTGTLDKFAEGLLLVLTGRALKLSQWFTHCDKQYEGTVCFGAETDTLDPEGAVIANAPLPSRKNVEQAVPRFLGRIEQSPPAYSAIHIDGERASALARRGEAPEMRKRPVTIYRLELLSWEPPHAKIFVHCSSGTYIRSLARDIALAAGSRAHLTALIRTQVGGFRLGIGDWGLGTGERDLNYRGSTREQHHIPNNNSRSPIPDPQSPFPIHPINKAVFNALNIPCLDIAPQDVVKAIQGKPLAQILRDTPLLSAEENTAAALFSDGKFIAMIERQDNKWSYGYVYARD